MRLTGKDIAELERLTHAYVNSMMEMGVDAIQVIGSCLYSDGDTGVVSLGAGNSFARQGVVRHWLERQHDLCLAEEISFALEPIDDEPEL